MKCLEIWARVIFSHILPISPLINPHVVGKSMERFATTQVPKYSISRTSSPIVSFDVSFLHPSMSSVLSSGSRSPGSAFRSTPFSYILFLYAGLRCGVPNPGLSPALCSPTPTSLTYSSTHKPIGLCSGLHLSVYALFLYIILIRSASKLFAPPKRSALWLSRKSR